MADLPDWLLALMGGQRPQTAGPISSASGGPPSMSYLLPSPPWAPQGLLAQGPLDAPPTFSYVNPRAPWTNAGGSAQGPPDQPPAPLMAGLNPAMMAGGGGPIGPAGSPASMGYVNPSAPWMRGSDASMSPADLPPLATVDMPRIASERDQPATATPVSLVPPQPPAGPTANVYGTPASGTPETSSPFGGIGNVLGKVGDAIGGIYGAGGPGDALIALGLSNRTGGKSIEALNAAGNQRLNQAKLAAFNLQMQQQAQQQNQTFNYFKSKGVSDQEAMAATLNPELQRKKFEELAGPDNYVNITDPGTNDIYAVNKHDPTDRKLIFKGAPTAPQVIGEDAMGVKSYGIPMNGGWVRTDASGKPMVQDVTGGPTTGTVASDGTTAQPAKAADTGPPVRVRGNEDYLKTLPEGMANTVRAIAEGREPYPVGLRSPAAAALKNAVNTYDPTFDYTNSEARHKTRLDFAAGGPNSTAGVITAGNTGIQHLGHLSDWAEELARTNTSVPAWNNLKNQAAINLGGGLAPKNFDTTAGLVSEELTKFYRGAGGNESDIKRLIDNLKSSDSPQQLRSTIKTMTDLVGSKVNALQRQWHQGMGPAAEDYPILQPESQQVLNTISDRVRSVEGGTPSSQGTSAPPPVPKFGEERKGFRYIGGPNSNPGDPNSWQKIGAGT